MSSSSRSHSKEPTRPALLRTEAVAGPSAASNGSESKSSQVSDTAEGMPSSSMLILRPSFSCALMFKTWHAWPGDEAKHTVLYGVLLSL